MDGGSIAASLGDEQDHVLDPAVAELQVQPTFDRLEVVENRFRLDRNCPAVAADNRIPRPKVAVDRERHLRCPSQVGVEDAAESVEQSLLADIADRVAGRIGPQPDVEADAGRDPGNNTEIGTSDRTGLDAADG